MVSSASIGGLVSGLDTASIISQLMQVEANPQTQLKSRLSTQKSAISSLQSLNAKFAALVTKANGLTSGAGTANAWSPLAATSSSTSVTVAAGATATPSTLSFAVDRTATSHQLTFATTAQATDVVVGADRMVHLDLLDGSGEIDLDTGDGTIGGLVGAVNRANKGVTASAVKLDDGSFRLRVVSTATGADSSFTLTRTNDGDPALRSDLLGAAGVVAGQDAAITVGSDTIHSSSNTFVGLVTGVDVTLASGTVPGTAVDVTVARDGTAARASLKSLVDSANELLSQIDSLTSYDAGTRTAGVLQGDSTVRDLRTALLDSVTRAADGSSLASLGVQTDRYGKIVFDEAAFTTAYAADPTAVSARLGAGTTDPVPGFAARLSAAADLASNSTTGRLTTSITTRQSTATRMQTDIDNWDVKLASKEAVLTRQFTGLEVALQKLQSQSSWLSSQVKAMSANSSGS